MNHSVVGVVMLVLWASAMASEVVAANQEQGGSRSLACLRGAVYAESKEEPIGVWQTFTRAMLNAFSSKDAVQRRMISEFREQLLDVRAAKSELLRRLQQFV